MIKLNTYLVEKLKINRNTDVPSEKNEYKYYPKNESELTNIIHDKIVEEKSKDKSKRVFDLNDIDTSAITDMTKLFWGLQRILDFDNVDISKWDVSNVKSFNNCFCGFTHFNCDLSGWDVSSCEDFESMFEGCREFNSDLSSWDFSKAKKVRFMFVFCKRFDTDVSNWNLANANSINRIFDGCTNFKGIGINKMKVNTDVIDEPGRRYHTFCDCPLIKKFPSWYDKD